MKLRQRKAVYKRVHPTESLHINIMSVDNPNEIIMFLFELSTLGCVSSNINLPRIPSIGATRFRYLTKK
ncbi:7509_t:CDS:1, partial [Gigaspora margarita]